MRRLTTTLFALLLACTLGAACNGETTGGGGSETHWLGRCTSSDQCEQGQCLCGVCTEACTELSGCNDGTLICASNQSQAYGKLCAAVSEAPEGVCLTPCDGTSCPAGNHCEGDACVPDPQPQRCAGGEDPSVCVLPSAQSGCSSDGLCIIAACEQYFADCNPDPTDGCETDIREDLLNCGKCGESCLDLKWAHVAEYQCENERCRVDTCDDGFADCDDIKTNGCEEDLLTSEEHCGDCDTACESGQSCIEGVCQ